MVAPERNIANFSSVNLDIDMLPHNIEPINERPADIAVNIQRGRPTSPASVGGPRSNSPSPVNSSPPSQMDYAERISAQNNMDVEVNVGQFALVMIYCCDWNILSIEV